MNKIIKNKLYNIWRGMKQRCYNKNHEKYECYGGRGIKICDEWYNFLNFENWAIKLNIKEHNIYK